MNFLTPFKSENWVDPYTGLSSFIHRRGSSCLTTEGKGERPPPKWNATGTALVRQTLQRVVINAQARR